MTVKWIFIDREIFLLLIRKSGHIQIGIMSIDEFDFEVDCFDDLRTKCFITV